MPPSFTETEAAYTPPTVDSTSSTVAASSSSSSSSGPKLTEARNTIRVKEEEDSNMATPVMSNRLSGPSPPPLFQLEQQHSGSKNALNSPSNSYRPSKTIDASSSNNHNNNLHKKNTIPSPRVATAAHRMVTPVLSNRRADTSSSSAPPPLTLPRANYIAPRHSLQSSSQSSSQRMKSQHPAKALAAQVVRMPRFSSPNDKPLQSRRQSIAANNDDNNYKTIQDRQALLFLQTRKKQRLQQKQKAIVSPELESLVDSSSSSSWTGVLLASSSLFSRENDRDAGGVSARLARLLVPVTLACGSIWMHIFVTQVRRSLYGMVVSQRDQQQSQSQQQQRQRRIRQAPNAMGTRRVGPSSATRSTATALHRVESSPLDTTNVQRTTTANPPAPMVPSKIHGLANYGQTCFLNSVLQALASLDPFVAYLERMVELEQARRRRLKAFPDDPNEVDDTPFLSSSLVTLLHAINGQAAPATNTRRRRGRAIVDPRGILQAVGQKHTQFRAKYASGGIGKEQQDAQEFLQALTSLVVEQGHASLVSPSLPSQFLGQACSPNHYEAQDPDNHFDDDDEILTVLSGRRRAPDLDEAVATSVPSLVGGESSSCNNTSSSQAAGLALSTLTVESEPGKDDTPADDTGNSSVDNDQDGPNKQDSPCQGLNGHRREEKKQEEFELNIPQVYSEDGMYQSVPLQRVLDRKATRGSHNIDSDCVSELSSSMHEQKRLSSSMQIMMSTVSSITPSPLCGWMGSALQCRACKHVRAIQCTPFYDLPVVPTSVSDYLGGTGSNRGNPPTKAVSQRAPPCTLEACLEAFTRVERVQDVDCRCCTMRSARQDLEQEAGMLRGAVASITAKAKRTSKPGETVNMDGVEALRTELLELECRLRALERASPDDDEDALDSLLRPIGTGIVFDDDEDVEQPQTVKLKRNDALKCLLLTRLPAILSIHVQRRYYDPAMNRMTKTTQHVVFPEYLNAAPYCAFGAHGIAKKSFGAMASSSSSTTSTIPYRLQAVIEHRGGAFDGHYITYRRVRDAWFFVSDEIVKPVEAAQVHQCQAYMLFYEAL